MGVWSLWDFWILFLIPEYLVYFFFFWISYRTHPQYWRSDWWISCSLIQCYQGKLTSGPLQAGNRQFHRKKNNEIESLVAVKKTGEQPSSLTNILGSKEFSVINGFEGKSKESIEKMILENGGLVKNIPGNYLSYTKYSLQKSRSQ